PFAAGARSFGLYADQVLGPTRSITGNWFQPAASSRSRGNCRTRRRRWRLGPQARRWPQTRPILVRVSSLASHSSWLFHLPSRTGWPGSHESLIVESSTTVL